MNKQLKIQNQNDKKAIDLLNSLIIRYREEGLSKIISDCNNFGNPGLNYLYKEIYNSCKNCQSMLALAGSGMFLEELINKLWISSQIRREQLRARLNSWDELMNFVELKYEFIEDKETNYFANIRPLIKKIIEPQDLESLDLLRDFIRNTFIHLKRRRLINALKENNIIPNKIEAKKRLINNKGELNSNIEVEEYKITHPLFISEGFKQIANQLAPAILIFIFDMFKKYRKYLAPLKDNKLNLSGYQNL